MSEKIPHVVRRNKSAMVALKNHDRNGAISACRRDVTRIESMLEQIRNQFDAVSKTIEEARGFAEDLENDPAIFADACREANKP